MQIQKRSFPVYVVLNCLTLGIYGMIVASQINKEVDALCKGDKEQPMSYTAAFLFRAIPPFAGLLTGFIVAMIAISKTYSLDAILGSMIRGDFSFYLDYLGAVQFTTVLILMAYFCVLFTAYGTVISSIYYNYWWYKQTNRLKLNASRYGLVVKENGIDTFLLRTVGQALFIPISVILVALSCVAPMLLIWIFSFIESTAGVVIICIIIFTVCVLLSVFGAELTTGANFSMFFLFKNLNRFADASKAGATPFDPMGYEYYPSIENKYSNFLPGMINGKLVSEKVIVEDPGNSVISPNGETTIPLSTGKLIGLSGSCAGYEFELTSGEEIVIGKDAQVSMVVIDTAYKEISRRHVGVRYDMVRDQYCVVDYSSNGTWANGSKLNRGQDFYLPHGTELKLANDKNRFLLA